MDAVFMNVYRLSWTKRWRGSRFIGTPSWSGHYEWENIELDEPVSRFVRQWLEERE